MQGFEHVRPDRLPLLRHTIGGTASPGTAQEGVNQIFRERLPSSTAGSGRRPQYNVSASEQYRQDQQQVPAAAGKSRRARARHRGHGVGGSGDNYVNHDSRAERRLARAAAALAPRPTTKKQAARNHQKTKKAIKAAISKEMARPGKLLKMVKPANLTLREGSNSTFGNVRAGQIRTSRPPSAPPAMNTRSSTGHQVPSAASGGVPDPTPAYLAQSALEPISLAQPRPILVVLDLNGTVLYRPRPRDPQSYIPRPHASSFLRYCSKTFRLVIWSSAQPGNVRPMCSRLLDDDTRARVVAIWARDKFGLSSKQYYEKTQCYKRLTLLWNDPVIAASHPDAAAGGKWDQTNTVLVDDSIEKARAQPHNLVEIPEFTGADEVDVLPRVHDFLKKLAFQEDVSRYLRRNRFALDSTETEGEAMIAVAQVLEAAANQPTVKPVPASGSSPAVATAVSAPQVSKHDDTSGDTSDSSPTAALAAQVENLCLPSNEPETPTRLPRAVNTSRDKTVEDQPALGAEVEAPRAETTLGTPEQTIPLLENSLSHI